MQTEINKLAYRFRQKWDEETETCEMCMPIYDESGDFINLMSPCPKHIEKQEKYNKISRILCSLDNKEVVKEDLVKEYVEVVYSLETAPETLTELAAEDSLKEEIEKEIRQAIQIDNAFCYMD